jgi:hypothetical protein
LERPRKIAQLAPRIVREEEARSIKSATVALAIGFRVEPMRRRRCAMRARCATGGARLRTPHRALRSSIFDLDL